MKKQITLLNIHFCDFKDLLKILNRTHGVKVTDWDFFFFTHCKNSIVGLQMNTFKSQVIKSSTSYSSYLLIVNLKGNHQVFFFKKISKLVKAKNIYQLLPTV